MRLYFNTIHNLISEINLNRINNGVIKSIFDDILQEKAYI